MPVARLLVEGDLDEALLVAVRPPDAPAITRSGSKGSLAPRAREMRREKRFTACYLRDRDFDHEPPSDLTRPTVDAMDGDTVLGWRWSRHEIESYLLEPGIVTAASGWDAADYTTTLIAAARHIAHYTAARWLLGRHRQRVNTERQFRTRPDDLTNEIKLPDDLSAESSVAFLLDAMRSWERRVALPSDAELIAQHKDRARDLLAHDSAAAVLVWHSGKDLLAALAPAIHAQHRLDPKTFSRRLRDWIRDHPTAALEQLPEWAELFRSIAAIP